MQPLSPVGCTTIFTVATLLVAISAFGLPPLDLQLIFSITDYRHMAAVNFLKFAFLSHHSPTWDSSECSPLSIDSTSCSSLFPKCFYGAKSEHFYHHFLIQLHHFVLCTWRAIFSLFRTSYLLDFSDSSTVSHLKAKNATAAVTAKSLQSWPTLCDPIPGILQARTLEWVTISFSNA